jgi:hypothetical protein
MAISMTGVLIDQNWKHISVFTVDTIDIVSQITRHRSYSQTMYVAICLLHTNTRLIHSLEVCKTYIKVEKLCTVLLYKKHSYCSENRARGQTV